MHRISSIIAVSIAKFAAFLFLVVLAVASAGAQSTGGVKGKVKNMNGDGIAGAEVTARQDGKDVRSTTADRKGSFRLDGLPEGTYNIIFEAPGYSSGAKFGVEIQSGKIRDLGERLILTVDRGTLVLVQGSVFYKDGTSVAGAKVQIDEIRSDGSKRSLGSASTSLSGEFTFRRKEGPARLRITASYKGTSAVKEVEVDSAAIYRVALTLDSTREN
ncbi:MAG: carboxypeptidase regulatory-like domain-containing protein [Acidobacteria bacterium]|nr:carboxypeptidase regulatory-like domain-containing protein [Acidobacteriota bacterium]